MGHEKKRLTPDEFLAALPEPLSLRGENSVPRKEAFARIRKDVKDAIACGALPAGTKVSIRTDHNSLRVDIVEWQGQVLSDAYSAYYMDELADKRRAEDAGQTWASQKYGVYTPYYGERRHNWAPELSETVNDAWWLLYRLANRHNFDESNIMTDYFHVGYYLHVDTHALRASAERGLRLEFDPKFAELVRVAHEAAKRLGPKVVKSVCGRGGVDGCGEWTLAQLLTLDKRANGKPLTYDARRRSWIPTDDFHVERQAERDRKRSLDRYHSDLDTGRSYRG